MTDLLDYQLPVRVAGSTVVIHAFEAQGHLAGPLYLESLPAGPAGCCDEVVRSAGLLPPIAVHGQIHVGILA